MRTRYVCQCNVVKFFERIQLKSIPMKSEDNLPSVEGLF